VGQTGREVAKQDGVHREDVVAFGVVEVPLKRDVIKVGQVLRQLLPLLPLL